MRTAGVFISRQLTEDPSGDARRDLIEYYYGDVTPGASLQRTLDAVQRLIQLRDALCAEIE